MGNIESDSQNWSRRSLIKTSIGMGISVGAIGAASRSEAIQNIAREAGEFVHGERLQFPEEYFKNSVDVERISQDELDFHLGETKRQYIGLNLEEAKSSLDFAQGRISAPSGKIIELNIAAIESQYPSAHVLSVEANRQKRLLTLITSNEPKHTKALLGPFSDENIDLRFKWRSGMGGALDLERFKANVSYIENDCLEKEILESSPEILPRFEHRYDLVNEAPYKTYAVLFKVGGEHTVLYVTRFLYEKGGTPASKLYSDTGRTDDVEWTTASIFREEKPPRIYFQFPYHLPIPYPGGADLLHGKRPIIRTKTENNNFVLGSKNELEEGSFSSVNDIITPNMFDSVVNNPSRADQVLSFAGLIRSGQLSPESKIVKDFFSRNIDLDPNSLARY